VWLWLSASGGPRLVDACLLAWFVHLGWLGHRGRLASRWWAMAQGGVRDLKWLDLVRAGVARAGLVVDWPADRVVDQAVDRAGVLDRSLDRDRGRDRGLVDGAFAGLRSGRRW